MSELPERIESIVVEIVINKTMYDKYTEEIKTLVKMDTKNYFTFVGDKLELKYTFSIEYWNTVRDFNTMIKLAEDPLSEIKLIDFKNITDGKILIKDFINSLDKVKKLNVKS